jgi:hypothetical protein
MVEKIDLNSVEELKKENNKLKADLRRFRPMARLAEVIACLEADADKWFREVTRQDEELFELTIVCKRQEAEIEQLKWSGKPWSGKEEVT